MNEPRLPRPRISPWWDRALVAAIIVVGVLEGFSRTDLEWRGVATATCVVLAFSLLWRRSHPLAALLVTFETMMLLELVARLNGATVTGLNTQAYVLLLPYALVRWASGRDIIVGLGVVLVTYIGVKSFDLANLADNIAGGFVLFFPAVLGAAVRYRERAAAREREQSQLREREQLARELHDSVAHYVSAIAVQAQAGLAVAAKQPDRAREVLTAIDTSARQALGELRTIVGTLRGNDEAEWMPQPGLAEIPGLARRSVAELPVRVSVSGDLENVSTAVSAALYRLAQESITNALRHARHASGVEVTVVGNPESISLCVSDDGAAGRGRVPSAGFGLVGMSERVALIGGTFSAGWHQAGGWRVEAEMPKQGVKP